MLDFLFVHGSYLGIILFLTLIGCGLPIPEEVPIITAGVLSSSGQLDPRLAFLACLIGAVMGDSVMYAIGHHFGHKLVRIHPRLAQLVHAEEEEKFEYLIKRHGLKVLFVARFLVGVRSPVYLSAGVLRVGYLRFLVMDLLCASVVIGLFFGLSYAYGHHVVQWVRQAELWLTIVVLLAIAIVAGSFYWRGRKRVNRLTELHAMRAARARQRADRKQEEQQEEQKTVA